MKKKDKQKYWPALKKEVDAILLSDVAVTPGLMFGYPAYYVNNKLALCHYGRGIALKLPVETALVLRKSVDFCEPFCPMGKKMGDHWVIITPTKARDIHDFSEPLFESVAFLRQLTT